MKLNKKVVYFKLQGLPENVEIPMQKYTSLFCFVIQRTCAWKTLEHLKMNIFV